MFNKIFKIMVCMMLLGSFMLSDNNESHIRLYVTSDVKGETEPCG